MFNLLMIALKDIYRTKFKTIVFSLIISTCISALILSYSMNMAVNTAIDINIINSLERREILIGMNNSDGKYSGYEDGLSYLSSFPHMEDVYRFVPSINARVGMEWPLSRGGYLLKSYSEKYFPKAIVGRNFSKEEKNVAIIAEKLYVENGIGRSMEIIQGASLIGKTISFEYQNEINSSKYIYTCKIVGIYRNQPGDIINTIYTPLNDMYEISENVGQYESKSNLLFAAVVDKQEFVDTIIKQLSSTPNISAKLLHSSDSNEPGTYKMVAKVSGYMVYFIFIFLLLTLYLCVTNISISNKKQVALYKALGYSNRHIFHIVFLESIIISLIGYVGGIIIAVLSDILLINPVIDANTSLALSIPISMISCFIPLISIVPIAFIVSLFSYFKVKSIYPAILLKED